MPREMDVGRYEGRSTGRSRGFLLRVAAALIGLSIAFAAAEIVARIAGYRPVPEIAGTGDRALVETDLALGWRNKSGPYVWSKRSPDAPIHMTFWPGGLRATAPQRRPHARRVLLIGGSYTQGWAVSDSETFGWRLQSEFPDREFVNLGTAGYGTYQSLLQLERYLAHSDVMPETVIYGFIDIHAERNVADPAWLRAAPVNMPHIYLDAEGYAERTRSKNPGWPLRHYSAAVSLVEDRYSDFRMGWRAEQADEATRVLIQGLDWTSRAHGAELLVVMLEEFRSGARDEYLRFFSEEGIATVDCTQPEEEAKWLKVKGYGHPNAEMNRRWADCIAARLSSMNGATRVDSREGSERSPEPFPE